MATRGSALQELERSLRHTLGGGWVLSGDEALADHDTGLEVRLLDVLAAAFLELVLEQERDDLGHPDGVLLVVGEAGEFLAVDQVLAVRQLDVHQPGRSRRSRRRGH